MFSKKFVVHVTAAENENRFVNQPEIRHGLVSVTWVG